MPVATGVQMEQVLCAVLCPKSVLMVKMKALSLPAAVLACLPPASLHSDLHPTPGSTAPGRGIGLTEKEFDLCASSG